MLRKTLILPLLFLLVTCTPAQARLVSSHLKHHTVEQPTAVAHLSTSARPRVEKYTKKQIAEASKWWTAVFLNRFLEAVTEQERLACDGNLPPCYVAERESKFNPYAVNPGHLGAPYGDPGDPYPPNGHASGKWQFMPGTWNGYAGYAYAAAAPVKIQNDKAREVWAGGAGASHWACC